MTTVLIVEDHPTNRDIIGRRLGKRGFTIRFAVDGLLAIDSVQEIKPDIILMDIGLGDGIDGCETTRRIKTIPEVAHIPVIALTASAFETDRQNALSAGCTDFDTKPVDLPRLLGKMNQALHA
jgi:CheY-like chemotaxis protein